VLKAVSCQNIQCDHLPEQSRQYSPGELNAIICRGIFGITERAFSPDLACNTSKDDLYEIEGTSLSAVLSKTRKLFPNHHFKNHSGHLQSKASVDFGLVLLTLV
jgi:hypothetical protein